MRFGIYSQDSFLYQNFQFRTVFRDYLGLVAQCFDVTVARAPGLECQKALRATERLQVGVDGNVVVTKKSFLKFLATNSALVGIQLLVMQVLVPDQRRSGRELFPAESAFNVDSLVFVVLVFFQFVVEVESFVALIALEQFLLPQMLDIRVILDVGKPFGLERTKLAFEY